MDYMKSSLKFSQCSMNTQLFVTLTNKSRHVYIERKKNEKLREQVLRSYQNSVRHMQGNAYNIAIQVAYMSKQKALHLNEPPCIRTVITLVSSYIASTRSRLNGRPLCSNAQSSAVMCT